MEAIERMVEADWHCIDLMHQLAGVQAAIGKIGEVVLRLRIQACVTEVVRSRDEREGARKIAVLVAVFGCEKRVREG